MPDSANRIFILTNSLDYGDAVSAHCIILKRRASELGFRTELLAASTHPEVRQACDGTPDALETAGPDDILLHQFFNETALMKHVEAFPGRRLLMYHNITPPEYLDPSSVEYTSCLRGLKQARAYRSLYEAAVGMSDFSRRDLERLGFQRTGVFPLLVDLEKFQAVRPDPVLSSRIKDREVILLHVGRLAPNKRIEDIIALCDVLHRRGMDARLILAGNDQQHPGYVRRLRQKIRSLGLREGEHILFVGKIPDSHLAAYYAMADAYVTMSEHEGFCAPLLEAMYFDVPVFAYAQPAVEETMGGAGVVFREKDLQWIALRLEEVCGHADHRESVIAAQRRVVASHGPDKQREKLKVLLNELLNTPSNATPRKRVSVVINTLNRAKQLDRCLRCLDQQTYRDFEVVVVQGPCTDDTSRILDAFRDRVRVVHTQSKVLSVSRNVGISACRGDLVAFIDDDAVAHPRWLEELIKAFAVPEVGAAGGLVLRMNGREVEFNNGVLCDDGSVEWNRPSPGTYFDREEGRVNTVSGNNCMFRVDALKRIGGFDERIEYYHDEADVILRLTEAGLSTMHKPGAIVYHEAASSGNRRNAYDLNWYAIVKNTLYCALKNRRASVPPWRLAGKVALRILRQRLLPMLQWVKEGRICLLAFMRMECACLAGVLVGGVRGLWPRPLYAEFDDSSGSDDYRAFPAPLQKRLSVGLLSQGLPDNAPGGIATYTIAMAEGLRDLGCEVHVVSRGNGFRSRLVEGVWYHDAVEQDLGCGLVEQSWYPVVAKNISYSEGVRQKLLDIEARWGLDLIESPNWDFEGLLCALEHHHPIVVRAHSPLFQVAAHQGWRITPDLSLAVELEGTLFRHADGVSGSTKAILSLVSNAYSVNDKCRLVPLGLDVRLRSGNAEPAHRPEVLFVGRLERRKGIHTLLQAIPMILQEHPDVVFTIIGKDVPDESGKTWQSKWRESGLLSDHGERVRFLGEVDGHRLEKSYRSCDIFVAPSTYESFGLIYVEAMAHAKPVVACRVGGVPEVVRHGETGILVPPEAPEDLARAILQLLQDARLRESMGHAGREAYEAKFTVGQMARRTLAFYEDVVQNWRAARAVVWSATALELRRSPECTVEWLPHQRRFFLRVPTGPARNVVHGPYIPLQPGKYVVDFKLALESASAVPAHVSTVDIFTLDDGILAERRILSSDFTGGQGSVFRLYFAPSQALERCEFRVHTAGNLPFSIREIVLRKWPTMDSRTLRPVTAYQSGESE